MIQSAYKDAPIEIPCEVMEMTTIFDVARYILEKRNNVTAYELQKLCYYSQAWSLALEGNRLFGERFEAWVNGPACRDLFRSHKGNFIVSRSDLTEGDRDNISPNACDVIDSVLEKYQGMSGDELRERTHSELPWQYARRGYKDGAYCKVKINEDIMRDYYRTVESDYRQMEDILLEKRAVRRMNNSQGTKSFEEAMSILGITAEDIEAAEDIDIDTE